MKKTNGFTLLELIISLAIISLIIMMGTQLLIFGIRGHSRSYNEFDIQSNIRIVSQHMNNTIRDSSGVFLLHRENANNLTSEWNYIMLSPQKDRMIHYIWNPSTNSHISKDLFPAIDGIKLDFELTRDDDSDLEKLLGLYFSVEGRGKTREINTELEAKNALQVVDRSYLHKANTLAYRKDTRLDEVSNSQAVVAMVLDVSASMANKMDGNSKGNDSSSNPTDYSRMKLMKTEAIRLVEGLSEQPNIYIGITPFSSTANNSGSMMNAKQEIDTNPGLKRTIQGLSAGGGTNTGDGIRRAYYNISDFNGKHPNKTNKNFMIILVDGVTTYASVHEVKRGYSDRDLGESLEHNGILYYYSYRQRVDRQWRYYYDGVKQGDYVTGNIDIHNNLASVNTYYPNGRYYGKGNSLDFHGRDYVNLIGSMVRSYKEGTNEAIKAYVIGFSADSNDFGSLSDIAKAVTGDTVYYEAGSPKALEDILKEIQRDITDALWHIGGPN